MKEQLLFSFPPEKFLESYLKQIILILICALCTFSVTSVKAQGINIKGSVKDASGVALIGVGIKVKDGKNVAVTGTTGTYSISVPSKDAILVFS
jgi:hypothetical protein